ncbi:KH domain-containing protein [bacterium]|nr:KH domain-containing protein [bacterium]
MAEETRDKDFIEQVVKMLVDNPDDVKVERKIDEMGVLISLDVNANDMGMVIGREGATAKALRTLLRVIGAKNNARVNLKINEPEGSERKEEKKSIDEVVDDINKI